MAADLRDGRGSQPEHAEHDPAGAAVAADLRDGRGSQPVLSPAKEGPLSVAADLRDSRGSEPVRHRGALWRLGGGRPSRSSSGAAQHRRMSPCRSLSICACHRHRNASAWQRAPAPPPPAGRSSRTRGPGGLLRSPHSGIATNTCSSGCKSGTSAAKCTPADPGAHPFRPPAITAALHIKRLHQMQAEGNPTGSGPPPGTAISVTAAEPVRDQAVERNSRWHH